MSDTLTPSGLQSSAGLYGQCGVYQFDRNGAIFNPLDLNPYLLFDAESSMIGTLENPTLDLDPTKQESLDVITATRAGTATFVNLDGEIEIAQPNTVRVDNSLGYPAILIEPSATNLLVYSEDIGQWNESTNGNGVSPVLTSNQEISPNGLQEADKIVFNLGGGTSTGDSSSLFISPSLSGQPYAGSIYLKGENGGEVILFRTVTGGYTELTLTTDWQRFESIETYVSGTRRFEIGLRGGIVSGGINNIATIYAWGAQLEESSVATSYIPTSGSTVTRAADDLVISGSDFDFYNQSEGTVYTEFQGAEGDFDYVYNVDQTSTDQLRVQRLQTGAIRTRYRTSGSDVATLANTALQGSLNRHAFSYKTNNFKANVNGGNDDEELSGNASLAPTSIQLGGRGTAISMTNIKRLIYWPYHSDSL